MNFDLGTEKFLIDNAIDMNASPKGDSVRIGLNYNFGHREEHHESMK